MKPSTSRFLSKPANVAEEGNSASGASAPGHVHRIELRNNNSKTVILLSLLQ